MKLTNRKSKEGISFTVNFSDKEFAQFCDESYDMKETAQRFVADSNKYPLSGIIKHIQKSYNLPVDYLGFDKKQELVLEVLEDVLSNKDIMASAFEGWLLKKLGEELVEGNANHNKFVKPISKEAINCATNDGYKCVIEPKTRVGQKLAKEMCKFYQNLDYSAEILLPAEAVQQAHKIKYKDDD